MQEHSDFTKPHILPILDIVSQDSSMSLSCNEQYLVTSVRHAVDIFEDVLNTAARIQEQCKVHSKDILISGSVLKALQDSHEFNTYYVDDIIPRGKEKSVRIWSVD